MHGTTHTTQLDFDFRQEEKLVAILVYSSFRGISTSMLRRSSVFTCSDKLLFQLNAETEWK